MSSSLTLGTLFRLSRRAWIQAAAAAGSDEGAIAVAFPEGGAPLFGANDIARWHGQWLDDADFEHDLEASDIRFGGDVVTEQ